MAHTASFAIVISGISAGALCAAALAQQSPDFWAVTGVQANDVLHLRDLPTAESRSLARIPPNARGLKHLGCLRKQLPFDQWVRMSEAARKEAQMQWCRVEYQGQQGWVAARFLKPDGETTK
jgi:hypothetical protein